MWDFLVGLILLFFISGIMIDVSLVDKDINILKNNKKFKKRFLIYFLVFSLSLFIFKEQFINLNLYELFIINITIIIFFELNFIYRKYKKNYYSIKIQSALDTLKDIENFIYSNKNNESNYYNKKFFDEKIKNNIYYILFFENNDDIILDILRHWWSYRFIYKKVLEIIINNDFHFYSWQDIAKTIIFFSYIISHNKKIWNINHIKKIKYWNIINEKYVKNK